MSNNFFYLSFLFFLGPTKNPLKPVRHVVLRKTQSKISLAQEILMRSWCYYHHYDYDYGNDDFISVQTYSVTLDSFAISTKTRWKINSL